MLHFVVTGWIDAWVGVGDDGRGRAVEPGTAQVTITMEPLDFLRLGSGRRADPATAVVQGDATRAAAVLTGLNVAP